MKIGVWHNTGLGGARRHTYHHVKGLLALGHEVVSTCPDWAPRGNLDLGDLVEERRFPLGPEFDGRTFKHPAWNHSAALCAAMEAHCREAARFLTGQGVDVLFATKCSFVASPAIARYMSVPSVFYIHDPWRSNFEAIPASPWAYPQNLLNAGVRAWREHWRDYVRLRNRRIFVAHEIANAASFTLRLANSCYTRETIWSAYGIDSRVCYQGVDLNLFKPQCREREPFVLGVGSYGGHKNVSFILQAMAKCRKSWPLVWIGSAGSEKNRERYEQEAARLGVDFRTLKAISDEELVDYYNRARLLVCAPRLEPFGLTPLEANACGLAVLGTREAGLRETIIDGVNGVLVDENVTAFAAALDDLMEKPAMCDQLGRNGIEHVRRHWSLDDSIHRLDTYLRSVCV